MLIHVLHHADSDERRRIGALLSKTRRERTTAEIRWLRMRMDAHGAIEYARETAHAMAGAARHECALAYRDAEPSRDRDFLEALSFWALNRG
jgi:geranylgeranyl diphosphate synthase type II